MKKLSVNESTGDGMNLPPDQEAIRGKCFNPSGTFVDFPNEDIETSIPARFEKIVRLYPGRIAVKFGEHSLTYEELNQAANRIASEILEQRGRRSEPIALLFEQGVDVLVAIFGVLKAGKFYVAVDPKSPQARIDYIMNDARARMVVTNGANHNLASYLNRGDVSVLNIDEIEKTGHWDESLLRILPDDFAALMYTSGSEGLPKGLVESHRFMLHTARGLTHLKKISPRDRLTLFHFVGFAASEGHLFPSLLNGACLCPFDIKSRGVRPLTSWLDEEGISLCHMPVSAYRHLAELLPIGAQFSQLRFMQLSGAPINRSDFDLFRERFSSGISLHILMGTTEVGAVASAIVDHGFRFPETGTPIGYAWPDLQLQLVDESGREVAPGQIGEISVRSRYMSAGYWREGNISRANFFADPDCGDTPVYRTGDLARMMPDGFLIHMGRKDSRVKIRGYRVGIVEIERALFHHPMVKEAAVVACDRETGEKYLAGYVVPRPGSVVRVNELSDFLRNNLPDYMIPSAFLFMESLPLTNGKLDRRALPKPNHRRPELGTAYVEASNEIEKRLVNIWEEILDVHPIGIDDNFFDLGGHSLLASQLFTRLDDEFGRLLPLSLLVDSSTIRLLANHFCSAANPQKISALVPFTQAGDQPAIFAVPGVYGNVVGLFDLFRALGHDRPFYGLQSIGLDGQERAIESIEAMAERYLTEVRAVQPHGPYILLGACFGAGVTCEMAYQLLEAGEEVSFLGMLDPIGLVINQRKQHLNTETPNKNEQPSSFLSTRLQLYLKEMRELNSVERAKFLTEKVRSLGRTLTNKKARRAVQREIHQLAVFNASKIAGQHYQLKKLKGRLRALEIFVSEHPRRIELENFDWATMWDGRADLHEVPGKDSGDMLSGENAIMLGGLLRERLQENMQV